MIIAVVHFISSIIIVIILCHYLLYIFIYIYSDDMQSEDAKFLKRKVKSGSIDVHPTEKALIVNYELEALILGQYGNPMHGNKKACQKVIRLHTLNNKTDCAALAKEVISKCNLIHSSKLAEVEQLIFYLKKRIEGSSVSTRSSSQNSDSMSPVENMQSAVLNCIDDYVELLYDDIPEKIRGSALILQLARSPDNLIELAKNEALLSALSRVLREEWKRSIELSTNIVYTFFCFSTYNEFHSVIIQYKIGSLCMDVIDYELKRYDHWKERVDNKKKPLTPDKAEPPRSRIPEPKRRPKSGTWAVADVNGTKNWSVCSSYHEDLCNASDDSLVKNDEELIKRKLKTLAKRQEQLLRVAFYLLLNIADNVKVEEKMHKKDIVGLLIGALRRHSNIDLLILIVSFLQKLSIYRENKNSMAAHNIVEVIATLLDTNNADLTNVALRLLFNLTFDTKLRNKIIKVGLLPKLITFTSDDKHMNIVMKVLYHLSMDDRVKVMFTQSDCVKLLTDMLLLNVSSEISMISSTSSAPPELLALCVNLAACKRAAAQMVGEGRLREIVARAFRHADITLMKLVRNLSQHQENQVMFIEFVGDIAGAITSGDVAEDFVIECLGVLSNILNTEIDIYAVAKRYNLIPFIIRLLQPDSGYPPDLVLEGVVCAGALAADESCAVSICTEGGTAALVSLLRVRQSDDEHVLQTVYAFRQMLAHNTAAEFLVNETEAPAYLIDLMQDKNPEIRKLCDSCLDIISQMQSDWATRIKVERFRCHNGQWLSVIEGLGSADAGDYNTDMDLPPYLSTDYLTSHNLFPSDSQTSLNNETDSLSGEIDINGSRPLSRYNHENEDGDFALMNSSDVMSATSFDNESVLSFDFAPHK